MRTRVAVVDAHGGRVLESLVLEDLDRGGTETVPADALFVLIGSIPHTDYLGEDVLRDDWGFILTGPDLAERDAARPTGGAR